MFQDQSIEDQSIKDDAVAILDTLCANGVAIFPTSVGYAIVGHAEAAIQRIYSAKERSFDKPCGNFGDWQLFTECMKVSELAGAMVESVINKHNLPFSVVAPFDAAYPMIRNMPPFTFANATRHGTMDMLLNAGPLHNALAKLARENAFCVSGSSANVSLSGSKFVLQDVQAQVRECADLQLDYGEVPYRNEQGMGSTIIDLSNFLTLRKGAAYEQIVKIALEEFDVDLVSIQASAGQS